MPPRLLLALLLLSSSLAPSLSFSSPAASLRLAGNGGGGSHHHTHVLSSSVPLSPTGSPLSSLSSLRRLSLPPLLSLPSSSDPSSDSPPPSVPSLTPSSTPSTSPSTSTSSPSFLPLLFSVALSSLLLLSRSSPALAAGGEILNAQNVAQLKETGFYQAFSLIFLSEIGDKTFFIAGLLAMKTSRFVSFVGSLSALTVMTVISVGIGQVFHAVPTALTQGLPIDDYAAIAAFTFFGYKTLKEALQGEGGQMDGELTDAEESVSEADAALASSTTLAQIASTFGLVFAAEFGDRSFLATIALGAAQNPFSVVAGAVSGHALATAIAVAGGGILAKYVSEKVVGVISGVLFLIFALTTVVSLL